MWAKIDYAPVLLPLGISFFTFQKIAFLVDCYTGRTEDRSLSRFFLFVFFFPQLVAGPIAHHRELKGQISAMGPISSTNAASGLTIMVIGLFKKVVLADLFAGMSQKVFGAAAVGGVTSLDAWAGALAFTLEIYLDFSGYSDIAIGISKIFGIEMPVNFLSPYKSASIIEFWRRWHITLSNFLRDYIYFPLGGSRKGTGRQFVNVLVVMSLGGLWHGAGWPFVCWGVLHGCYLVVNHAWRKTSLGGRFGALGTGVSIALTMIAVVMAWVLFRADSLATALTLYRSMVGLAGGDVILIGLQAWWLIGVGAVFVWALPNTSQLMAYRPERYGMPQIETARWQDLLAIRWRPDWIWGLTFAVVGYITLGSMIDPRKFIYFNF